MRRHGLFGGTFDPVHRGHVEPVREIARKAELDSVSFLPSSVPPHRPEPVTSIADRLEMVHLAVNECSGFDVDEIETRREGPSYTFDTVQSLDEIYPDRRHALILGLDVLPGFDRWHRWQELLQRVHLLIMVRPGYGLPDPVPRWLAEALDTSDTEPRILTPGKVSVFDVEPVAVSATCIRIGIANGEDMSDMLAPAVWDYIREHNLYE